MNDDCKLFLFILLQITMEEHTRTFIVNGASYHSPKIQIQGQFPRSLVTETIEYCSTLKKKLNEKTIRINWRFPFEPLMNRSKMQGIVRAVRSWQETLKIAITQHSCRRETNQVEKLLEGSELGGSSSPQKGLENITVAEIVLRKGDGSIGSSWLSCRADDSAIDAVQNVVSFVEFAISKSSKAFSRKIEDFLYCFWLQMARNNIGSLVVLKPEGQHIAGIVTERGNWKAIDNGLFYRKH